MNSKKLYKKYKKTLLSFRETCEEIGISTSAGYKLFSNYSEQYILKHKLFPEWRRVNRSRKWHIKHVSKWCKKSKDSYQLYS